MKLLLVLCLLIFGSEADSSLIYRGCRILPIHPIRSSLTTFPPKPFGKPIELSHKLKSPFSLKSLLYHQNQQNGSLGLIRPIRPFYRIDPDQIPTVAPSDLAQNCSTAIGSLASVCRKSALVKYNSGRLNTANSTVWETCCSAFTELTCYQDKACKQCHRTLANNLIKYSVQMEHFLKNTICQAGMDIDWTKYCDKNTHQAIEDKIKKDIAVINSNHQHKSHPNRPHSFINLPKPNEAESVCMDKLKKSGDLVDKCIEKTLKDWDPMHSKAMDNTVRDTCCAMYEVLDCIAEQATTHCTTQENKDMVGYRQKCVDALAKQSCSSLPYNTTNTRRLCSVNSAQSTSNSILLLLSFGMLIFKLFESN